MQAGTAFEAPSAIIYYVVANLNTSALTLCDYCLSDFNLPTLYLSQVVSRSC